jgi:hypothetical protein
VRRCVGHGCHGCASRRVVRRHGEASGSRSCRVQLSVMSETCLMGAVGIAASTRFRLRPACRSGGRPSDRKPPARRRPARSAACRHRPDSPRQARPRDPPPAGPSLPGSCTTRAFRHGANDADSCLIGIGLADRLDQQHGPGLAEPGRPPHDRCPRHGHAGSTRYASHLGTASDRCGNQDLEDPRSRWSEALSAYSITNRPAHLMKARG